MRSENCKRRCCILRLLGIAVLTLFRFFQIFVNHFSSGKVKELELEMSNKHATEKLHYSIQSEWKVKEHIKTVLSLHANGSSDHIK